MIDRIKELALQIHPKVIGIRKHIHMHPELSFEEKETAAYICSLLDDIGVSYTTGWAGGTGIVATLGQGKETVALRADIDALPIEETSEHDYCSTVPGVMHACGHDVHTSSLIGTIMILKELEDELTMQYKFIFQPGEEKLPGGASMMIADGALDEPAVDKIYGQHVHPSLPVGQVGICSDYFMASCDELYISVKGSGGHGAMPQDTVDPIRISAELIQSLQSVVSRNANPSTPTVLSIGKINSQGGATNIIPDEVLMEGTFRTFDEEWRAKAHQHIHQIAAGIAQAHGAEIDVNIVKGYPALYNNPELYHSAKAKMIAYLGADNVIELPQRMTAEDFSYYSQRVPAFFYRLGTAGRDGSKSAKVHTSTFDIDEEALLHSIGLMAWIALGE